MKKRHSAHYGPQQNSDFLTAPGNGFGALYYKLPITGAPIKSTRLRRHQKRLLQARRQ